MDDKSSSMESAAPAGADRIEKQVVLNAPPARVWQALTDSAEFGRWFRARLDGPFAAGARVSGQITYPGYEHYRFAAEVVAFEPQTYFAFRWPHPADPAVANPADPTTLVEFRLAPQGAGTLLTIVESGFAALPPGQRDQAFRGNSEGWAIQSGNLRDYLEQHAQAG